MILVVISILLRKYILLSGLIKNEHANGPKVMFGVFHVDIVRCSVCSIGWNVECTS